jgi:hypothetical protein
LRIDYERHASNRLINRCSRFGLNADEASLRVEETLLYGRLSRKKYSKRNLVYYKYFYDNISFFVVCRTCADGFIVKTVILSKGRE